MSSIKLKIFFIYFSCVMYEYNIHKQSELVKTNTTQHKKKSKYKKLINHPSKWRTTNSIEKGLYQKKNKGDNDGTRCYLEVSISKAIK